MELLKDRLKKVREFLGKSQKEMARSVEVSVTAWQNYESGVQYPGGKVFETLSRLEFDVNWLLIGVGEMRRQTKLKEIGGEPVPQPVSEHLDKRLLFLTLTSLKPVFEEFSISNYEEQAGVITDVYSSILERNLARTPESVDKLTKDMRSFLGSIDAVKKLSNFWNFMRKK